MKVTATSARRYLWECACYSGVRYASFLQRISSVEKKNMKHLFRSNVVLMTVVVLGRLDGKSLSFDVSASDDDDMNTFGKDCRLFESPSG
jgi:hypothetical protein